MANKRKKKDGPSPSKDGIPCACSKCRTLLGNFLSCEDHGSLVAVCPKCKAHCVVFNSVLLEQEEDPETYDLPLKCYRD